MFNIHERIVQASCITSSHVPRAAHGRRGSGGARYALHRLAGGWINVPAWGQVDDRLAWGGDACARTVGRARGGVDYRLYLLHGKSKGGEV